MALHDLTPQLRTRLSRVERWVGLFVTLATLLLLAGFVYYVYHTAKRRGWMVTKVPYYALMDTAAGLRQGDPIKLMGFEVGEITQVEPMPPDNQFHVYVAFIIKWPFFGYIWNDSEVRVGTADLLGNRFLEITKGGTSGRKDLPIYATFKWDSHGDLVMLIDPEPDRGIKEFRFESVRKLKQEKGPFKGYQLIAYETPSLGDQLTRLLRQFEGALPNILSLTNTLTTTLTNTSQLALSLNDAVKRADPMLTNLAVITDQLRNPEGSLGRWLLTPELAGNLQAVLSSANGTLRSADTNLSVLSTTLNQSLLNLALITSNLNAQVQANQLILTDISSLVVDADTLVQGLKRHWLLKSAFAGGTNDPTQGLVNPTLEGKP
jgi:ABC-type transporter Mla subunit MlaD